MCKTNKKYKKVNCAKCQYAANSKLALFKISLKNLKNTLAILGKYYIITKCHNK